MSQYDDKLSKKDKADAEQAARDEHTEQVRSQQRERWRLLAKPARTRDDEEAIKAIEARLDELNDAVAA